MNNKALKILDAVAEWSICALIFVLPFSKTLIETFIVTAAISIVARKVLAKEPFVKRPSFIDAAAVAYIFFCLLSIVNTEYIELSVRAFFTKTLKFSILFFVSKEIIDTGKKFRRLILVSAVSCLVVLVDGFIQYYVTHVDLLRGYPVFLYDLNNPSYLGVPTASFPYPNDYAAWLLVYMFPVIGFTFLSRALLKYKIAGFVASAALLYSFFLTQVRGAWLSFAASFGIFSAISFRRAGKIIALITLALLLTNKDIVGRFYFMSSVKDRGVMWNNSYRIFKEHPVIGNGINTFFVHYARVREDEYRDKKGSYAHNCYLQMAAETGIAGLLAFLIFAGALIQRLLASMSRMRNSGYYWLIAGFFASITAFLLHSAVDTNLYSLPLAALFWLISGIAVSSVNIAEHDTKNSHN